eukprot:12115-Heterococcus_DN1.PRE.3
MLRAVFHMSRYSEFAKSSRKQATAAVRLRHNNTKTRSHNTSYTVLLQSMHSCCDSKCIL